jgi:nitroreductase/molybdopterin/thiamine biosynthesis adenylyltransferase
MTLGSRITLLASAADTQSFRPRLLSLAVADEAAEIAALCDAGKVREVHDRYLAQLGELVATRSPKRKLAGAELDAAVGAMLAGIPAEEHGTWVFYPWSGRLVHVLEREAFRELRSSRNRYKITPAEQSVLREKRIGVVGLSVGQASAVTMALEGVGGALKLADFDELALSNMNRLRAGVHELGLNKCVIAARQIAEIDPYLPVELHLSGINDATADAFLTEGGNLDLLVEECDDMFTKIFLRERARALRIPVLMETNDRGMLDVERFDTEPDRPILHGLLRDMSAERLKSLPIRDKLPLMLRLLGPEVMRGRASASLFEVEESISSWPQLASGTMLGGALTTDVGRRILLGEHTRSGRYFVDLATLVRDGSEAAITTDEALDEALARKPVEPPAPPPLERKTSGKTITREDVRKVVSFGTLAPSGGNVQPWRFVAKKGRVRCFVVPSASRTLTNFGDFASYAAVGAAVENMDVAARALGLAASVKIGPDPDEREAICDVTLSVSSAPVERPALADVLAIRATNRRLGPRSPLPEGTEARLVQAAQDAGGKLLLAKDPAAIMELAGIVAENDRQMCLSRRLNREMAAELRWTEAEVVGTRDGIDVLTLEAPSAGLAAARMASSWEAVEFLSRMNAGGALGRLGMGAVALSSAVGLVVAKGNRAASYFQGGRALQRVWLEATSMGVAMQPLSTLVYLFARLERGGGKGLDPAVREGLAKLRERFRRVFDVPEGDAEVLLFRLFVGAAPSARSLRRSVDDVLTFE